MDKRYKYPAEIHLTGEQVRGIRERLDISSTRAGQMAGLANPTGWHRWERNGVSGPTALLVLLMGHDADAMQRLGLRAA